MNVLREIFVEALIAFTAVSISIITKHLTAIITALIEKAKAEHKATETELEGTLTAIRNKYLTYLKELVVASVNMVSQTYVNKLKENGEFTKACQQEAFNKAVRNVKQMLDSELSSKLKEVLGDVDTIIGTLIEQAVLNNNNSTIKTGELSTYATPLTGVRVDDGFSILPCTDATYKAETEEEALNFARCSIADNARQQTLAAIDEAGGLEKNDTVEITINVTNSKNEKVSLKKEGSSILSKQETDRLMSALSEEDDDDLD